jgi:lipopolysaccharide/colanic/teichoic acid biosynthesis glycosyltransferase
MSLTRFAPTDSATSDVENGHPPRCPVPPDAADRAASPVDYVSYAEPGTFPEVWWLTRIGTDQPRVNVQDLPRSTVAGKRLLDVVVAAALLLLLAPVMLLVAVLVKLTSRGPVIFQQTRVGLNLRQPGQDRRQVGTAPPAETGERRQPGTDRRTEFAYGRHFTLYKFRTMRTDAEREGARFAVRGDSRVTPIGRFLRKTRLDELPQLWNVLRGEMSLVGPRPERPEFMQQLSDEIPNYLDRLGLKPGLTGVAQILNGYDNEIESFRRKVAFDLHYLQNCSVWNDVKILVRTVKVVLTGSGAL